VRVLDLFSGIGGFSLGLERAGMKTVAFCEIDPFCRRVLAKHWPNVPCFEDVRTLRGSDVGPIDVICGGFPCQDISHAGKQAGLAGERSGLWSEITRLVGELRPRFLIVENVAALLSGDNGQWFGTVLGDLATLGYDAEWHCIPASAVGAPHIRDRVWIVAYPCCNGFQERKDVSVSVSGCQASSGEHAWRSSVGVPASEDLAYSECGERSLGRSLGRMGRLYEYFPRHGNWPLTHQPVLDRGADGIPARLDRLRSLGNAVVPQIPEIIGRAILAAEKVT